jgi:hypothetical protein
MRLDPELATVVKSLVDIAHQTFAENKSREVVLVELLYGMYQNGLIGFWQEEYDYGTWRPERESPTSLIDLVFNPSSLQSLVDDGIWQPLRLLNSLQIIIDSIIEQGERWNGGGIVGRNRHDVLQYLLGLGLVDCVDYYYKVYFIPSLSFLASVEKEPKKWSGATADRSEFFVDRGVKNIILNYERFSKERGPYMKMDVLRGFELMTGIVSFRHPKHGLAWKVSRGKA